ncbi:hypothetical protein L1987_85417 [Smallanthus sonchifolius]|uniref:Uncharacterized protein n=1 Tax=Smallanthus sonchifolius TaxID=185202 RepID=A0ACB8XX29_9ASTR|nr:hypothetical protein L1987_85417 [Smallanthus sonchifolius]
MDPHSFIARAEAQRWLGIAEKLLMGNDLVGSKTFAIRARESDPRLEAADQILAITDTLLAADKRVVGTNGIQQPDFYAILQLVRFVPYTDHIAAQYQRLAALLNPHQNRFPYSDQALQLVNDAWTVLSNPIRKSLYDADLDFQQPQQMNTLGFNIEQQHHHQQHQQQHQHNFFSINLLGTNHEQEFQPRVSQGHQQQQLQQHNFLSQNPVRSVPVSQEQLFQQQVQPFQITSTPPPPPQAPFSWPQPPPPLSQPQQQLFQQQEKEQQESLHIDSNNDVRDGQKEMEAEAETEKTETAGLDADVDDSPSFWTTCPYCFYMYEYPSEYAECVLRCDTCKRAFQAVRIPSPPQIIEGQESYFYCWGFFPLAVSMSHMQKNNDGTQKSSKWAPFSPMCDVSSHVKEHLDAKVVPKNNVVVKENLGLPIYIDDETDDIFEGISEPSDESDLEWNNTKTKKAKRMKKDRVKSKNLSNLPASETGKKGSGVTTRRQSGRSGKEMGKLDLNVEFNNNEGEEPGARAGSGNRGNAQGDGDNIEGIGFFEGLDEFFSSLPILSVVNDEKVKAG